MISLPIWMITTTPPQNSMINLSFYGGMTVYAICPLLICDSWPPGKKYQNDLLHAAFPSVSPASTAEPQKELGEPKVKHATSRR
jgi:hypothetical protein